MAAGLGGLALASVVLLCGAGNAPIENFMPQGAMQADLNAGGHSLTNAATVSATNIAAANLTVNGKALGVNNALTLAGTDGSTLNVGAGGTLGSAAFTASTAFDAVGAAGTAQTNAITAAESNAATLYVALTGNQTIAGAKTFSSAPILGSNSFKTSGGTYTLTVPTTQNDTLATLGANQTFTGTPIFTNGLKWYNGNKLIDGAGNLYFARETLLADGDGNIYYSNTGYYLADQTGNLYYGNGETLAGNDGYIYYGNGSILGDPSGAFYADGGLIYSNGSGLLSVQELSVTSTEGIFVTTDGSNSWNIGKYYGFGPDDGFGITHIGTGAPFFIDPDAPNGALEITSSGLKSSGFLYPGQFSTTGAPSYVKGGIYFDTTLNKLRVGGASTNETILSGASYGSYSATGTATTSFTVTIGQTMANTTYAVNVTGTDANAATGFYISAKTTTTFTVTYLTGLTGPVAFDWAVFP